MPESTDTGGTEKQPGMGRPKTSGGVGRPSQGEVSVKTPEFSELSQTQPVTGGSLSYLMEVKFDANVLLGRSVLSIEDIVNLSKGSVVQLDRQISEPVDLVIQGVKVATGEVVVVDDCFAIRIQEIANPPHHPR